MGCAQRDEDTLWDVHNGFIYAGKNKHSQRILALNMKQIVHCIVCLEFLWCKFKILEKAWNKFEQLKVAYDGHVILFILGTRKRVDEDN